MGAFYINTLTGFLSDDSNYITGILTNKSSQAGFYDLKHSQTDAWDKEIPILKASLESIANQSPKAREFGILLEYPIARREKRIDAVIIANNLIIVIEFKVGQSEILNSDKDQLLDYCLDLRDFHFESRDKIIVPILVATNSSVEKSHLNESLDFVKNIRYSNSLSLGDTLIQILLEYSNDTSSLYYKAWDKSDYSPTPTIIEAAQTLYAGKSVVEISQSHSRKKNLSRTSDAVIAAIKLAKADNKKIICFITGVPGAGKTLAGLNIAHHKSFQNHGNSLATFLSGNGPLVKVLIEALTRDAHKRLKEKNNSAKKKETERVISFIENVHRFLDHYFLEKDRIPNNKVVIFDEAQRAWNREHSKRKFDRDFSEAEMMFEVMSRHSDWAVIVALVGGGQEINTGEAGLPEWGRVIQEKFSDWTVYISAQIATGNHSTGNLTLFENTPNNVKVIEDDDLHLEVSIRSYKAEKLSHWVNLVLLNKSIEAKEVFQNDLSKYKLFITRDLSKAKIWLKTNCKGSRRMGLVASSGGRRLRPYGLDVKIPIEEKLWFLNEREDVRSSYYLETPATEFGIQGLELDWVGVCWDLDLRRNTKNWEFKAFEGTKWKNVLQSERKAFTINKYRVLLTRAREGMIIFVPPGDRDDPTRNPEVYDLVANYLISCGVTEL